MANLNIPVNLDVILDTKRLKEAAQSIDRTLSDVTVKPKLNDSSVKSFNSSIKLLITSLKDLKSFLSKPISLSLDEASAVDSLNSVSKSFKSKLSEIKSEAKTLNIFNIVEGQDYALNSLDKIENKLLDLKSISNQTKSFNYFSSGFKSVESALASVKSIGTLVDFTQSFSDNSRVLGNELLDLNKLSLSLVNVANGSLSFKDALGLIRSELVTVSEHTSYFNEALKSLKSLGIESSSLSSLEKSLTTLAHSSELLQGFLENPVDDVNRLSVLLNRVSSDYRVLRDSVVSTTESISSSTSAIKETHSALDSLTSSLDELDTSSSSITTFITPLEQLLGSDKVASFSSGLDKLGVNVTELFTTLGESSAITSALSGLSELVAVLGKIGVVIGAIVAVIKLILGVVKKVITTIVNLVKKVISVLTSLVKVLYKISEFNITTVIKSFKLFGSHILSLIPGVKALSSAWSSFTNLLSRKLNLNSILNATKEAVTLSSDLIEVANVIDTVFEDASDQVLKFAENATESFGLTSLAAQDYASQFGAFFKSSDIADEKIADMSTAMTGLLGDVASLRNMTDSDVFAKFASGLAGHTMALQSLGVTVSMANLNQFALERGINESVSAMASADKVMLRYYYIIQQLDYAVNDFTKTQGSWANQIRLLTVNAKTLGATLGQILQKWLYPFVVGLNTLIARLQKVATWLTQLFGATVDDLKAQQGLTDDTTRGTDLSAFAGGYDDVTDSIDDATDAQKALNKEQKKSLANIHQLNVLSSPSDTSSSSGSSSSGVGGSSIDWSAFADLDEIALNIANKAEDATKQADEAFDSFFKHVKSLIENNQWLALGKFIAETFNSELAEVQLSEFYNTVKLWSSRIATTLNGFINYFSFEDVGRIIGEGLNNILFTINTFYTTLNWTNLGVRLAQGFNTMFSTIRWDEIGKFFTNGFNSVWKTISGFVTTLDWESLGDDLVTAINSFIESLDLNSFATSVVSIINGVVTLGLKLLDDVNWDDLKVKLVECFNTILTGIDYESLIDLIIRGFGALSTALGDFLLSLDWDSITEAMTKGINKGIDYLNNIDWAKSANSVSDGLLKVLHTIEEFLEQIHWQDIFNAVYNAVKNVVTGIDWGGIAVAAINIFIDAFYAIGGLIFTTLKSAVSAVFENFNFGEFLWNIISRSNPFIWLASKIGSALASALKKVFNSSDSDSSTFTTSYSLSSVSAPVVANLPHLAKGAVIPPNNQFMAVLGDQKRGVNIETPLETMLQAFRGALAESEYSSGVGDIVIPIYVNSELSSEEIIRKQDIARYRSNGK